jgi:membrane fusion protein, macrolide-specific efflux system
MRAKLLNTALLLAAAGVGVGGYFALKTDKVSTNTTRSVYTVAKGNVQASVTASGNLAAKQQADLTFESAVSSGPVSEIRVKVGDNIEAGQWLAVLDSTTQQVARTRAEVDLRTAEVALAKAQATITGADRTAAENALADARLAAALTRIALNKTPATDAVALSSLTAQLAAQEAAYQTAASSTLLTNSTALTSAEAAYAGALVAESTARKNHWNTVLRAPFAGRVTAVNGVVGRAGSYTGSSGTGGASSALSTAFVQIADLTAYEVKAPFPEADAAKLAVDQTATVAIDSLGARVPARIRQIDTVSTLVNNVVTYYAYLAIDQPPTNVALRPGQTANVSVAASSATDVLFLPSAALTARGQTTTVQVAPDKTKPSITVTREITLGLKGDTTVEVKAGLNEGDTVVTTRSRVSSGTATTGTGTQTGTLGGGGGVTANPTGGGPTGIPGGAAGGGQGGTRGG